MPPRRIDAVIFDFGNVICSFSVIDFIDGLAAKSGKSTDELLQVMPGINHLAVEYETGLVSSDEFFTRLCALAGIVVSRNDFINAYTGIFTPIQETHDLVRSLKPNYKLGLLSNTNEWHYLHSIRPVEIYPLFDAVTLSFEVKAMKPAAAIYADMLKKLGLPPGRCVYIDDILENTKAAERLGLHAIQYIDPPQLRTALQEYDVIPG